MTRLNEDESVLLLLDQPEILDELEAGISTLSIAEYLGKIGQSMSQRQNRSARWYELAVRANERAATLANAAAGESDQ